MPDEPKKYQTEDEKIDALEAIQDKPGGPTAEDMAEIESISTAEVTGGDAPNEPSPADDVVEADSDAKPATVTETPEQPTDETRNWQINDALIQKYDEEYMDEHGRKRPFITHKNPDDFVKSYIGAQKNNYYLKNTRIPQEFEKGKEAAEVEYNGKLAALQKELDDIKAKPVEQTEQIVDVPTEQPKTSETYNQLKKLTEEINLVSDEDTIEHTDKLKKAFLLQNQLIEENSAQNAGKIDELKQKLEATYEAKFNEFAGSFQKKQEEAAKIVEDDQKALKTQQSLQNVYAEIDSFVSRDKTPPELKSDQKYVDMYAEATEFHNQLAELYTGKTRHDMSLKDWQNTVEKAGSAYLSNLPELVAKVNGAGLTEPRNYKKWVELDNIDAIRTGYIRNPQTQQWERRYDNISGQPINLGDMATAYNWILDNTGQREKLIQADKNKDTKNLVKAINKRDQGVVQLDDSMMSQDGEGQVLTEEDALAILQNNDITEAMSEYNSGNKEPLNKMNAALSRVGSEPVTP